MPHKLLLISLPLVGSAIYLTYHYLTLSRTVHCLTTPYLQDPTLPIPPSVQKHTEKYILHHELARKSIPASSLHKPPSSFLIPYLRHTMTTFSTRPPAWMIWFLLKHPDDRATFNPSYINALTFAPGERVCGTYIVQSRSPERVTLSLDAPRSYVGPEVEGLLVVEVKEEKGMVVWVNHTVMWREKGKGKRGVWEGSVGRWVHGGMVRGLVEGGVRHVLSIV